MRGKGRIVSGRAPTYTTVWPKTLRAAKPYLNVDTDSREATVPFICQRHNAVGTRKAYHAH